MRHCLYIASNSVITIVITFVRLHVQHILLFKKGTNSSDLGPTQWVKDTHIKTGTKDGSEVKSHCHEVPHIQLRVRHNTNNWKTSVILIMRLQVQSILAVLKHDQTGPLEGDGLIPIAVISGWCVNTRRRHRAQRARHAAIGRRQTVRSTYTLIGSRFKS